MLQALIGVFFEVGSLYLIAAVNLFGASLDKSGIRFFNFYGVAKLYRSTNTATELGGGCSQVKCNREGIGIFNF